MPAKAERILCFDVGGTGLKAAIIGANGKFIVPRLRIKTPRHRTPAKIVPLLVEMAGKLGKFDHITVGFPGVIKNGRVIHAPAFGDVWHGFDLTGALRKALKKPIKVLNDADVQGLAAIKGKGLELVCTLGTGFGTAWFRDGELMPHMDLSHLVMHRKDDFDKVIGDRARRRIGNHHWNKRLHKLIGVLETVFAYDHLYLGGGNSRCIKFKLPRNVTTVSNDAGMEGGAFAWTRHKT